MLEIEKILGDLISINSVSGNEKKVLMYIERFLDRLSFKVTRIKVENNRWNIFAKKGNPKVLFYGHVDTVAAVKDWTNDPFKLKIKNDRAFGLGTWDMKGGVAAILYSIQKADNVAVLFTVDEEEISLGVHEVIKNKKIFSGIRGIISAEAGNEPGTYGGVRHISTGRFGRIAYTIEKLLEAGHAATAESNWHKWVYEKISNLPKTKSRIIVRNFHAISDGLSFPNKITMDVDVLISPEEEKVEFLKILTKHFESQVKIIPRKTPYMHPYACKKNGFFNKVVELVKINFGEPSYHIGYSVGDENALAKTGLPILIIGPEGRNEHAADEWVSLNSLSEVCELYQKIIDQNQI